MNKGIKITTVKPTIGYAMIGKVSNGLEPHYNVKYVRRNKIMNLQPIIGQSYYLPVFLSGSKITVTKISADYVSYRLENGFDGGCTIEYFLCHARNSPEEVSLLK